MKVEDHVIGTQDVVRSSQSRGRGIFLPGKALAWRRRFSALFQRGKVSSSMSVARQRRKETFDVTQKIHGGSAASGLPGAIVLIDTTLAKSSSLLWSKLCHQARNFRSQ